MFVLAGAGVVFVVQGASLRKESFQQHGTSLDKLTVYIDKENEYHDWPESNNN